MRILLALALLGAGIYMVLMCLLGAPSFWYLIASGCLVLGGLGGFFSTAFAGYFGLPAIAMLSAAMLQLDVWHKDSLAFLFSLGLAWVATLIALAVSRDSFKSKGLRYAVTSLAVLGAGFGVDRAFTNKIKVHTFEMSWAIGINDPLGTGPESVDGQTKVVVYRRDQGFTCYDSIYSNELAQYLERNHNPTVRVEYEVFYDFGKDRAYNVRSIDGLLITKEGHPVLQTKDGFGGTIGNGNVTGACNR